ncbi:MAG: hypothetical protein AB1796_06015 [Bacillota bacterium]
MRKTLIVLLVIGLLVVGTSQVALAFGLGNGNGMKTGICGGNGWFDSLPPEVQEKISEIKETYREQLTTLKEKIWSLREARDFEGLTKAREEMAQLKEEIRQKIEPLLPEEYREKYGEMGPGKGCGIRGKMMRGFRANEANQF